MGYTSSASTQTVSIDLKLTDLGRKKLIYGSGTNIKYFTLHDEGINYTSTVKPARGTVPAVAGDKSSNKGIAPGIGFKRCCTSRLCNKLYEMVSQSSCTKPRNKL